MNQIDVLKSEVARITRSAGWWGRFAAKLSNNKRDLQERVAALTVELSETKRDLETSRRAYNILYAASQKDGLIFQSKLDAVERELVKTKAKLDAAVEAIEAYKNSPSPITGYPRWFDDEVKACSICDSEDLCNKHLDALAAIHSDAKEHGHATLDEALGCEDCQNEVKGRGKGGQVR